ncbi:hypothetical protein D3C84_725480 [compost metagenome]
MHPRGLDVVEAGHGARQLAFQATPIARGFHELAGAEALFLVENLEADAVIARRHAGGGQAHAGPRQVIGLDQQGTRIRFDGIADVGSRQGLHDLGSVHPLQAAIQRTVIRLLRPEHHGETDRHAGGQADQQAELAQHRHIREVFQKRQAEQRLARIIASGSGGNVAGECVGHDLEPSLKPASA